MQSIDEVQHLLTNVLDWAGRHGAKLYWIRRMRTAVSVLFNYKFGQEVTQNAVVRAVIHAHAIEQLPVKTPLRLRWEIPQLLEFVRQMSKKKQLTFVKLTCKCIVLIVATSAARFSETPRFSRYASHLTDHNSTWAFLVRVKNREYREPITLHRIKLQEIHPILAMKELRTRIRRKMRFKCFTGFSFFYEGIFRHNMLNFQQMD
jgi:hypothetical protein